jgi:hypothetical protein
MTQRNHSELEGAFRLLDGVRRQVEKQLSCSILHDRQIGEEVIIWARKGFGSSPGTPNPNPFTIAAHLAFWIRKLKPFRILRLSAFVAYLDERRVPNPFTAAMLERENQEDPKTIFVNEMIAVNIAFGIIRSAGIPLKPKPDLVQDFIVSLRYHSFSPNAMLIILESMVETSDTVQ